MAWKQRYRFGMYDYSERSKPGHSLQANEQCFIRKEHRCGKIFGASKSCFIACPTDEELDPILELISEKLSKVGVEPIIAVKERAYGQDIFCTKICGKIIEARFCLVILDDSLEDKVNIPNPNVYYEYGLMTSLRKHIIPLQKVDLELAFNIQSYDTIKYSPGNIASELDRAIKDAIKITETEEEEKRIIDFPEKTILRRFELAGFEVKGDKWFLSDVIDDTLFIGFGHHEERFYLYLGKIDEVEEFQAYLEDLDVLLYRTEKKAKEMQEKLESQKIRLHELIEEDKENVRARSSTFREREMTQIEISNADINSRQELMSTIYVGFIVSEKIDISEFEGKVNEIVDLYDRYKVSFSTGSKIDIGELEVLLERPTH